MSKIKILKAHYYYLEYLNKKYSETVGLPNESYENQYEFIMSDKYAWADTWKKNLEKTGDYEVMEIISNGEIIQKQWAKENDFKYNGDSWLFEIIEKQIEEFKPDILFIVDNANFTQERLFSLKEKFKNIKLCIGYDGIAINDVQRFLAYDIVLSCLEDTAHYYSKQSGKEGYFFPLAFEKTCLDKIIDRPANIPFSFIGSLVQGQGYHNQRTQDILQLCRKTPIKLYTSGLNEPYEPFRYLQRNRLKKGQFREFWDVFTIGRRAKEPVFGMDMYQLLADSKMTFNSHIDSAGNKAANMRLFEATGVGTCLVTDYKDNLSDFFDINNEVVTYKSIPECIDKVKNLLRDEPLRKKIAAAGQSKTLSTHTYQNRVEQFSIFLKMKMEQKL